jgi:glycosyltransferase involved in cell wall biosynthesis
MLGHYTAYVDLLATVSQTIKQNLERLPGFASVPIKYLPLGVPMPAQPISRDFQGRLRIAYVGRLAREQKRVQLFPQILRDLQASGIPFEWTLAGDGPEETWLRQAMLGANAASAERAPDSPLPEQTISFRGQVPYADVPKLLSSHDVFLLASDYEGLPLTLLEAMGNGLVAVVSDLPSGIRELVDENTGRRVAPEDVHGYAREIVWLHEHRSEMARFSTNAREKVRHDYSVAAMTDRWLAAFGQAPPRKEWPRRWSIEAPLDSPGRLRFTSLGRSLRKIKLRLHGQ